MRTAVLAVIATATALTISTALSASGAATTTVTSWTMTEPTGATVMTDASGNGLNGSIGSAVKTGTSVAGAAGGTAYRWAFTKPNAAPTKPERLVKVPDSPLLDPGARDYAVTIRYRTTQAFGNLLQKGQSGTAGGYWKFQAPKGVLGCLFRERTAASR